MKIAKTDTTTPYKFHKVYNSNLDNLAYRTSIKRKVETYDRNKQR